VRTAVIDPDGKVRAIHNGMEWTPEQIADELRRVLSAK
jgi:cytochrome oxidase Cu insertion factor (SCO1/SenC/PrrC family)